MGPVGRRISIGDPYVIAQVIKRTFLRRQKANASEAVLDTWKKKRLTDQGNSRNDCKILWTSPYYHKRAIQPWISYRLTQLEERGVAGIRRINDPVELRRPVVAVCKGSRLTARQPRSTYVPKGNHHARSMLIDEVVHSDALSSSKLYAAAKLLPPSDSDGISVRTTYETVTDNQGTYRGCDAYASTAYWD